MDVLIDITYVSFSLKSSSCLLYLRKDNCSNKFQFDFSDDKSDILFQGLYCWSGQRANLMVNLDSAC